MKGRPAGFVAVWEACPTRPGPRSVFFIVSLLSVTRRYFLEPPLLRCQHQDLFSPTWTSLTSLSHTSLQSTARSCR